MNLRKWLHDEESFEPCVYKDSEGYWTLGIGRLVDERKGGGITLEEAFYLLDNDIARKTAELEKRLPWIKGLDEVRRAVLIAMAFQLGVDGLLGFKQALAFVQAGVYAAAANEMLRSKWAHQTPARAKRTAKMMETGQWPK